MPSSGWSTRSATTWCYDRIYPIDLVQVSASAGTPDSYEVEDAGSNKVIRIGDADTTITGMHTYTIVYRVEQALNAFDDHDELYWNAIGSRWEQPIDQGERARFAERTKLFSEYLPDAIVFGCTDKWARAFAGIDGELPAMGWYGSPHPFTVGYFSSSMDGFTTTTAGTMTSTPSGSGSSGFSGGGGSSGGGGGGGGGSW